MSYSRVRYKISLRLVETCNKKYFVRERLYFIENQSTQWFWMKMFWKLGNVTSFKARLDGKMWIDDFGKNPYLVTHDMLIVDRYLSYFRSFHTIHEQTDTAYGKRAWMWLLQWKFYGFFIRISETQYAVM